MNIKIESIIAGVLFINLSILLNVTKSNLLLNFTKTEKYKHQINHCEKYDKQYFQCENGACLEKKYQCDGLRQCTDGSDEWPEMCNTLSEEPNGNRVRRSVNESCAISALSPDKLEKFFLRNNPITPSEGYVPENTRLEVTCADNYYLENGEKNPTKHYCHSNLWYPPITKCVKKCDRLNPVNVILKCYRHGVLLNNCDGNSVLLAGTKIEPSCKRSYTRKHKNPAIHEHLEITCNEDGKWEGQLFECVPTVPECGVPYTPAVPVIAGGDPEPRGGSPWHVAIFDLNKVLLICGGTIITEHLVLSAAHCFDIGRYCNSATNRCAPNYCNGTRCVPDYCNGTKCVEDFEVVIGKYYNNYTSVDNFYQRTMKIKEIHFPPRGYRGLLTYYNSDIVILVLKDPIPISPFVLPACLNWVDLKDGKLPSEGERGKVVGWGSTVVGGNSSMILMNLSLPFISNERCLNIVPPDFLRFVTLDKFCAGTENNTGPTVLPGDSGGGLLFKEENVFYLRGIVSVKQRVSNSIAVFTDLSYHIRWIESVRNNVEKQLPMNSGKIAPLVNITNNQSSEFQGKPHTSTNQWCVAPEPSENKTITFPRPFLANVTCATGFYLENEKKNSFHLCVGGKWAPEIPKCLRNNFCETTPNSTCVLIGRCPSLEKIFQNFHSSTSKEKNFLRRSLCGKGGIPKVCCETSSILPSKGSINYIFG